MGKEKGKGERKKNLAGRRENPSPAREKKGAAARPLDGGVLTHWGARAPARGPATAPWLPRSTVRSLAVSLSAAPVLALRRSEEESGDRERLKRERERRDGNELGFWAPAAASVFISPETSAWPSDQNQRRRLIGPSFGPGGRARRGTLPAQAQVAAWVRPVRARTDGPNRLLPFFGPTEKD